MPIDFVEESSIDFQPESKTETGGFRDLSKALPLRITQPTSIPRIGPTSTIYVGPKLAVDFNTDFRGPTQTLADALSEAYGVGTGSPSESLLGIRPEAIPSGQKITEETGVPRLLTVPASAIAKAGAGLGQFLTSVGGGVEVGTAGIPGVGLFQRAKWIYDMAKGAGESTGDLSAKLEMAAKNPEGMKGEDWQSIADDAANSALMLYGSGKLSSREFSKLTGVRAPLGRLLESEKTRVSKDVAEELKKSEFTPTEQTAESIRRLGANVPIGPFAQPGVLELADAALAERMNPIVVPGQENAALNALRRAVEPPQIVPVTTAKAERIAGGGEAPYGKVSYMRGAEAPLPESTQVPTTPPVVIQSEPPEAKVEAKPEAIAETAPVAEAKPGIRVFYDDAVKAYTASAFDERFGNMHGTGETPELALASLQSHLEAARTHGTWRSVEHPKAPEELAEPTQAEPAKPPLSEPGKDEIKPDKESAIESLKSAFIKEFGTEIDPDLFDEVELEPGRFGFRAKMDLSYADGRPFLKRGDVLTQRESEAKSPVAKPEATSVAGEEGKPGTVTAAAGTASQKAAISEAKPETGGLQETKEWLKRPPEQRLAIKEASAADVLSGWGVNAASLASKMKSENVRLKSSLYSEYQTTYEAEKAIKELVAEGLLYKRGNFYRTTAKARQLYGDKLYGGPQSPVPTDISGGATTSVGKAIPPERTGVAVQNLGPAKGVAQTKPELLEPTPPQAPGKVDETGQGAAGGEKLGWGTPIKGTDLRKDVSAGDYVVGHRYDPQSQSDIIEFGKVSKVLKGALDIVRPDGTKARITSHLAKYSRPEELELAKRVYQKLSLQPTPQPAAAKVELAAKVEAEVKRAKGAPFTMTFEQFLQAPREGPLLEAMRKLPKREKTPEEVAAAKATDDAYAALEKAKLTWMVDHPEQGVGLSKAKRKIWDNYNKAWQERQRVERAHQEEAQRFLYDELVKAGIVEHPDVRGEREIQAEIEKQKTGTGPLTTQERVELNELRIIREDRGKLGRLNQARLEWLEQRDVVAEPTKAATPEAIGGELGRGLITGTAIDKWADDVLRGGATHLAPEVFAAYLVRGASLIERGIRDFAAWSAKMVEMYGPAIEPHLKSIFDAAGNTLKRAPITESGTLKSARQIVEQRLGMASAAQSTPQAQISPQPQATSTTATAATAPTAAPPSRAGTPATTVLSGVGLDDIYRIFEPEKKPSTPLRQRASNIIESFRTGFSSKFRPVNKLAEDIAKAYGLRTRKDIAGIIEQLKGSRGKGEADIYRFDRSVSDLVKGQEKDFNAYMFLRRSLDRLRQDQNDPNKRRAVAGYTIPVLEAKLATLEQKLGNDLPRFQQAANAYQAHLDNALRLQVESGRMSQEVYNQIKSENQFYAPFKVMKWLEEGMRPEGTGRKVDTVADYTKAMEGIEDPEFKLGDMLAAGRQNILISRILADKAVAMRHVADLANVDTQGLFIRKLFPTQEVARGWNAINVFENGKKTRYAVRPDVADALQLYGTNADGFLIRFMGALSVPFKAGATALNIPFQVSNLLADVPRQALVSKYGIRGVNDLVRYPLDFVHALYSSMVGDMVGTKNKLFLDFLDSGAAQTTIQEHLTPQALRYRDPATMSRAKRIGLGILYTPAEFAAAIEQTSKILGVKRAMRFEGVGSGKELAKQIPDAVTEIRRFSGSPDFGRQGKWTETARLNLLYMFLNARIQGAVADVGRLTGRDGWKRAAITWMRVGSAIGIPTAYLYALNNSPEYKADYDKIPQQNKDNYWHIPKDTFITNEDGEKMRDYWRIPKRESAKWIANMGESAMDFAQKRNPQAFVNFAQQLLEDISPVNIQGNTAQERLESAASGLNPVIKGPLEVATGREMYRHRDLVPDTMKKASPEMQFTDRTSEAFKKLAVAMPDVAPEFLRSPLMLENITRNLTAGLITQFLGGKPVEGRSELANLPLLQRFQRTPYTDNEAFTKEIQGLERESADEYLTRHRTATDIMQKNKGMPLARLIKIAGKDRDMKLMQQVVDLWSAERNGATRQDRQLIALAPKQRAEYLAKLFSGMTPEAKRKAIVDLAKRRVLTEAVFVELPNAITQLRKD